jgi:hypothetical protein
MSNFDAVVGARRGSAAAQAARDIVEAEFHERTLVAWAVEVENKGASSRCTQALFAAYERARALADEEAYAAFAAAMNAFLEDTGFEDTGFKLLRIARVAAYGDPMGWPGLTAPAVRFLGQYFSEPKFDARSQTAGNVIDDCFRGAHDEAYYERVRVLAQALATVIARTPGDRGGACTRAAAILKTAPTFALTGALSSWVTAFAQRIDNDLSILVELRALRSVISAAKAQGDATTRLRSLAPLAEAMDAMDNERQRVKSG